MEMLRFEWHVKKALENKKKHGVSFEEERGGYEKRV